MPVGRRAPIHPATASNFNISTRTGVARILGPGAICPGSGEAVLVACFAPADKSPQCGSDDYGSED
ncbi:hypothetical protein AA13594_1722 [Gluconacetobacter azotocaptans DSM 13594]|nr:hypothetical protein AA13594_1722 [Gluconacetobacter azotocaptans DSM 13594]